VSFLPIEDPDERGAGGRAYTRVDNWLHDEDDFAALAAAFDRLLADDAVGPRAAVRFARLYRSHRDELPAEALPGLRMRAARLLLESRTCEILLGMRTPRDEAALARATISTWKSEFVAEMKRREEHVQSELATAVQFLDEQPPSELRPGSAVLVLALEARAPDDGWSLTHKLLGPFEERVVEMVSAGKLSSSAVDPFTLGLVYRLGDAVEERMVGLLCVPARYRDRHDFYGAELNHGRATTVCVVRMSGLLREVRCYECDGDEPCDYCMTRALTKSDGAAANCGRMAMRRAYAAWAQERGASQPNQDLALLLRAFNRPGYDLIHAGDELRDVEPVRRSIAETIRRAKASQRRDVLRAASLYRAYFADGIGRDVEQHLD